MHSAATQPPSTAGRRTRHVVSAVRRFLLRIDVALTAVCFLFFTCIGVLLSAITRDRVTATLMDTWHILHEARVTSTVAQLDLESDRVYRMAATFMSIHSQDPFDVESENTLATLCALLVEYDVHHHFRGLTISSMEKMQINSCLRGGRALDAATPLSAAISYKTMLNATYVVDSATYMLQRPLKVASELAPSARNVTQIVLSIYQKLPIYSQALLYSNRTIDHVDPRLMWEQRDSLPHLIYFHFPAGLAVRGLPHETEFDLHDAVQVRVDGSRICVSEPSELAAPELRVAALLRNSLALKRPRIMSNNWGQSSVSDDSSFSASTPGTVTYLEVANLSDPLMREALKHVDVAAMQTLGYHRSVDFHFRGAAATVTALSYQTRRGLVLPLVLAASMEDVTGPHTRLLNTCNGVLAAVIVLLTCAAWRLFHVLFAAPLQSIAATMQHTLTVSQRTASPNGPTPHRHRHHHRYLCLTEMAQLLRAYAAAAAQLRRIHAFIPNALRRASQGPTDSASPATTTDETRGTLHRHTSTAVYISITTDAPRVSLAAAPTSAPPQLPVNLRAALAAVTPVSNTAHTDPFAGPESLAAFVVAVQELCRAHHGTVHRLCPDACVLHFNSAVRAHLPATAAPAPAPAAVAPPPPTPAPATRHGVPAARSAPSPPPPPEEEAQQQQLRQQAADTQRHAARDARNAAAFALALASWVDAQGSSSGGTGGDGDAGRSSSASPAAAAAMPDVRALLDTSVFTCGQYRPAGSEQTLQVALGRDVQRELGRVPQRIGVRVAMTEETAVLLRGAADAEVEVEPDVVADGGGRRRAAAVCDAGDAVRQLPVDVLRTGRAGLDECTVVLYEALPGRVAGDAAWQCYARCCVDGFAHMLRGDYAGALAAYRGVADIADLEPGLLPAGMRREAAASAVTGGAASVQVARLVRECEQRVRHRVVEPLCRVRACPLGVDAVLGDAARVERVDDGAEAALPAELQCPERRASSPRTRADVRAAAQQEGRYGASGSAALVTRTATRHVAIIDGTQTRTAHTGSPESLTDNWGVTWRVATKLRADKGREGHSSHYVGMGLSGGLCSIRYRLFRDVPPMVSAALKDTAPGHMSDAMRSAVPLIAASAEQRTAVHALFGPFVNGLRHPHIVACLGYCVTLEGGVAVLSEYCSGGSLREMLHQYGRVVKPATIGRFAICILRGLQFLHSNGLVHGSVRPENVLVCADGRCRLKGYWTDHALAHRVLSIPRTCYVSPEMAAGLSPTPASDVFCYGLTVVELATGQLPWVWAPVVGEGPQRSPESLTQVARAGGQVFYDLVAQRCVTTAVSHLQAAVDADHPVQGALIAKACLAWNPVDRPSVAGVRRRVEQLAEAYAVCVPE